MKVNKIKKIDNKNRYVYDISLDGTVINALGNNVCSNTDGFNYQMPDIFQYTKENPYIGKGLNRNVKKDKEYIGVEGDVAEFNDLYMRGKMGLGIDEFAQATINFSRKNYADYFPNGEIKYVGNTIKSKRMPIYIEKFMEDGIKFLLNNKGKEFLEFYYDYIEKIYNLKIPLKDIATKGRVKKTIEEYKKDCQTLTKAGRPKNRQVWYELLIQNNVTPDINDTVYYINTGDGVKKSSYKDVEKITKKDENGNETYEIKINCIMLDNNIIDSDDDFFCYDGMEYNAPKYIEQFNKRIKPLLVCFNKDIRDKILIKNPNERQSFTIEDSQLSSGEPNKVEDQDTYEELMTMDDKEIKYWISVNEEPPFINEIEQDWLKIVEDYKEREKIKEKHEIKLEIDKYNDIINKLTETEVNDFIIDSKVSKKILDFLKLDVKTMSFISKEHNVKIGSIYDIVDKNFEDNDENDDEDSDS